ncbi:beta-glucosidase BglX [Leptobacterium flavescens]|uniref:beta-glucosidase n=1 Tax=Leptobacterium flavescens TaxID=472055 RepID=A0A6P0UPR9_9FLAO|nr:beta-glucosidase BglX [Leptobacterium flavescens]NER15334.1 beta-glucosidase BglX [Leptobacterium flavescens]
MKKLKIYGGVLAVLILTACNPKTGDKLANSNEDELSRKVDSVLSLMTLKEKIGQMNQYNGFWDLTGPAPSDGEAAKKYEHLRNGLVGSMLNVRGVKEVKAVQKVAVEESRLGIPLVIGFDAIHGYKTISPIPLAEAASWDMAAIQRSAEVSAAETAASGINWTFAPMVDISRDPRWGRVMEGAGEDPYLGSMVGVARVKGFQGDDLSAVHTIAACAKHFAGYGFSEAGKDYNTVDVSESLLQNVIFPPFKMVKDAGVRTFMNSFNDLNGSPATGNAYLQRTVLKGEWEFDGMIVSDWGSIAEMIAHGYAEDGKHASEMAVNAGSDMDMESYLYIEHLEELVAEKKVDVKLIDDAVRRILRLKFELGLFDDPYKYCDEEREKEVIGSEEHREAVLDMAKKSIVLLKNENNLLPLKKSGQKIALIGPLAADNNSPLGSWRIAADDHTAVSVLDGMKKYEGNNLIHEKGAELVIGDPAFVMETKINTTDKSGFEAAKNAARGADVVVMVLGEHGFQSGEGRSRVNLDLPGVQQELLKEIYKINKNIVLVLMNGRPLTLNWEDEHIPAIVETWHLGTESGNAIAQVLYGDYNPSGKLPMTFPRSVGQVPVYYNYKNTGRPVIPAPNLVFWTHYIDEQNSPLYPFGHGLSYTTFEYDNLQLDENSFSSGGSITASVDVTNTGDLDGKEVVQFYIRDLVASTTRPVKELKGFELVELKKGEKKTIRFEIDEETIEFFTANRKWEAEAGNFKLFVGGSSVTTLETDFRYED